MSNEFKEIVIEVPFQCDKCHVRFIVEASKMVNVNEEFVHVPTDQVIALIERHQQFCIPTVEASIVHE